LRKYKTSSQRKLATRRGLIRIELTLAAKQASAEAVDRPTIRLRL
jgi:hypothetical protein